MKAISIHRKYDDLSNCSNIWMANRFKISKYGKSFHSSDSFLTCALENLLQCNSRLLKQRI
jgi:hypothetical protein